MADQAADEGVELRIEFDTDEDAAVLAFLDDLVAVGIYGADREAVCAYLLTRGLDDLYRCGVLRAHDKGEGDAMPNAAGFAGAIAGALDHGMPGWPADGKADPYFYVKSAGSGWAVGGPNGFHLAPPRLDKNVAFLIAKLLSGKLADAKALLNDLPEPGPGPAL